MSRLDHTKDLWDQAKLALDLPKLEKATAIWHSAAEAEKLELESSNLRRTTRSESARFWIPVVATIISSTALVGTLIFQIGQFKENTRLQTEAAEESQYRQALTSIQNPEGIHGAVAIPLLATFFDSSRYGKQSREVALNITKGIVDYDSFRSLFEPIARKTEWSNYQDVVRVEAILYDRWQGWRDALDTLKKLQKTTPKKGSPSVLPEVGMADLAKEPTLMRGPGPPLSLSEAQHYKEQTEKELLRCEDVLVQLLKRTQRPQDLVIDLSGPSAVYLGGKDLSRLNLRGAVLTEVVFSTSKLDGADLWKVSEFDQSEWEDVAWWRVARLSRPLLEYLKKEFPYSQKGKYDKPATQDEYEKELARLESTSGQPSGDKH